jgi:hypothetical protein
MVPTLVGDPDRDLLELAHLGSQFGVDVPERMLAADFREPRECPVRHGMSPNCPHAMHNVARAQRLVQRDRGLRALTRGG